MGYSKWSDDAYDRVSSTRKGKSRQEIFSKATKVDPDMDPRTMKLRESRDSEAHPSSNAIIVGFDVTGSMGDIPERFAKEKLGGLMTMLTDRGYVSDPQVLFAAIGDAKVDRAPFQVGQFESGLEMDMWLTRMWLEGGGGDAPESYGLAHWFAAHHTSFDAWEKRGRKGFLFTIADEANKQLSRNQIERVFGYVPDDEVTVASAVKQAKERWHVFHIHVTRGGSINRRVGDDWTKLLGDRLLVLDHVDAICELIGVTIGVVEGTIDVDQARTDLGSAGLAKLEVEAIVKTVEKAR